MNLNNEFCEMTECEMLNVEAGGIGSAAIGVVVGFGMGCVQKIFTSAARGKTPSGSAIFKAGAFKAATSGVTGALFGPF